jgi:AraC-like DNA-binding protein
MIEILDTIFRFGAVMCSVLTAALVLRDARHQKVAWLSALLSVSTGCFLIVSSPGMGNIIGLWMLPLDLVGQFSPILMWVFTLFMFDDKFSLKPVHCVVAGLFWLSGLSILVEYYFLYGEISTLSPAAMHFAVRQASDWYHVSDFVGAVTKLGMVGHMLLVVWRGRDDDLLERRRQFRSIFVISGAFLLVFVGYSFGAGADVPTGSAQLIDVGLSGAIFAIILYFIWNIVRIDSEWILGDLSQSVQGPRPVMTEPTDIVDLSRLDDLADSPTLMESGLTITRLSEIAQMPEHRLRRLINQHLGFRNFSDFLNHHRIAAAKSRLADKNMRHTPVLTIAMDLGYGSLGPFNRAFKERTGLTPTEFRRNGIGD